MRTIPYPSLPQNSSTPTLLIVGSWPAYGEDLNNAPFTSVIGEIVRDKILKNTQIPSMASVFLTHAIRCHPLGLKKFTPTVNNLAKCKTHLENDMRILEKARPSHKILLILGGPPARSVMKDSLDNLMRKNSGSLTFEGWTVFASYNPIALLVNSALVQNLAEHITMVENHIRGARLKPSSPHIVSPYEPSN